MLQPNNVLVIAKRAYPLQFHKVHVASKRDRNFNLVFCLLTIPANIWGYFFVKRRMEMRHEREKITGTPQSVRFVKDRKPYPWGDGKTAFFPSILAYWGLECHSPLPTPIKLFPDDE